MDRLTKAYFCLKEDVQGGFGTAFLFTKYPEISAKISNLLNAPNLITFKEIIATAEGKDMLMRRIFEEDIHNFNPGSINYAAEKLFNTQPNVNLSGGNAIAIYDVIAAVKLKQKNVMQLSDQMIESIKNIDKHLYNQIVGLKENAKHIIGDLNMGEEDRLIRDNIWFGLWTAVFGMIVFFYGYIDHKFFEDKMESFILKGKYISEGILPDFIAEPLSSFIPEFVLNILSSIQKLAMATPIMMIGAIITAIGLITVVYGLFQATHKMAVLSSAVGTMI